MRARAAEISTAAPDERLPVPPTGDEVARLGTTLNEMLERLGEALEHERRVRRRRQPRAAHAAGDPARPSWSWRSAQGRSPEELRAALASAAEETDRLTQLSEDLLTIAQTERGELPLRLGRGRARRASSTAVERRFARRAAEAGRRIEVGDARRSSTRRADRLRIDQAIGSLVDNALRYGAGTIELLAAPRRRGGRDPRARRGRWLPGRVPRRAPSSASAAPPAPARRRQRPRPGDRRDRRRAHGGEAHAANRAGGGADVWISLPGAARGISSPV